MVVSESGSTNADLSYIYSGMLEGGPDREFWPTGAGNSLSDFDPVQRRMRMIVPELMLLTKINSLSDICLWLKIHDYLNLKNKVWLNDLAELNSFIQSIHCFPSLLSYLTSCICVSVCMLPPLFTFLSVSCLFNLSFSYLCSVSTSLTLTCYLSWPCLAGENGSACHGSVLQGQFEGTIHTDNGTYHIEPVHRYTSSQTDHHSIIYHEDDMGKFSKLKKKVCNKCF